MIIEREIVIESSFLIIVGG